MDPFRLIFLNVVRDTINKDPGRESLCDLFKLTTPDMEDGDVDHVTKRLKLHKQLKLRLHPDKHPGDKSITALYQEVDIFITECTATLKGSPQKKKKASSPDSTRFPFEFDVQDSWPHLSFEYPQYPQKCWGQGLASLVAYQCINARGSIAHGKKNELSYKNEHALKNQGGVGVDVIIQKHGGSKSLFGIDDIKEELTERGPVVSTSFFLSSDFVQNTENAGFFVQNYKDYLHPVLIVGWKLTSWLVKPLYQKESTTRSVRIAFGQFNIDQHCVAPTDSFENRFWQPGPYFGISPPQTPKWRTSWTKFVTSLNSLELEKLGDCFENGLISAEKNKSTFTIYAIAKRAHSRKCYLKEVNWKKETKTWRVEMTFVD